MAPPPAPPRESPRRTPRSARIAAMLLGTTLSLPAKAHASDPGAILQAAGIENVTPATALTSEPPPSPVAETLPTPPADFAGQEGVLALFDGRVVAGTIHPAPGGYLLKRPGSTDEMIPTFLVQTASDSLTGCYENLRGAIRTPRPDDHLKLADWCVRQRLLAEAKEQVLAALHLDPNRREARDLLVKLEEATSPRPRNRQSEEVSQRTRDGFLDSAARTTEGLGPELTSRFVRRIQPLMVSKCGNAACHGGTAGAPFHLENIRRNSASGRTTTLENLRHVLTFIDAPKPDDTRLLSALSTASHRDAFSGPGGEQQAAAIRDWVQGAAADKGLNSAPAQIAGTPTVWTPETIELASAATGRQAETKAATPSPPAPQHGHAKLQRMDSPPALRKVAEESRLADTILKEERPDPFDPNEFNRRVQQRFGQASSEIR